METTGTVVDGAPSRGRLRTFRAIAAVMAASAAVSGLFTVVFGVVGEGQEVHAFHNVVVASLLLILSAPPAVAAARAPQRAAAPLLHLVAVGVAGLVTMALSLMIDVYTLPFIVLTGVLVGLRVAPLAPLRRGRPSIALGVLVAAGAVPLVAYALGQAELQRIDAVSEHAQLNHWVETSFAAVAILLLGTLAALRPRAFRPSAWTGGLTLALMGGASLLLQGYPSALDVPWAWAALVGGVAFPLVREWEARREDRRPDRATAPAGG